MDGSEEMVIMSQDFNCLYTSLDREETVRIIGRLVEESEVEFKDIDYRQLGKYLAIHLTPDIIARNHLICVFHPGGRRRQIMVW